VIPRPVIIDCDPGQDDAIALLIALASPEALQVLGVTCVGGNAPLNRTQTNARRICVLANRADLPVFAGCAGPLLRVLTTAQAVHGESGMDGSGLPDAPAMPLQERHAVDFIVDTCLAAADRGITLCVLGPMTNIAVALTKAPDIAAKIRGIVFMGGVVHGPGNVTPSAEFNIFTDPHAARIVFACGVPLVMFGLDVTHKVITTPARLDAIAAIGTPVAAAAATPRSPARFRARSTRRPAARSTPAAPRPRIAAARCGRSSSRSRPAPIISSLARWRHRDDPLRRRADRRIVDRHRGDVVRGLWADGADARRSD